MKKQLPLRLGDALMIMLVLLAAIGGLLLTARQAQSSAAGLYAEIYLDNRLVQTVALAEGPQEIRLESASGYNLLYLGPEGIRMLAADCAHQDCLRAGTQSRSGDMLACLPHRLLVRLSGGEEAAYDAISR